MLCGGIRDSCDVCHVLSIVASLHAESFSSGSALRAELGHQVAQSAFAVEPARCVSRSGVRAPASSSASSDGSACARAESAANDGAVARPQLRAGRGRPPPLVSVGGEIGDVGAAGAWSGSDVGASHGASASSSTAHADAAASCMRAASRACRAASAAHHASLSISALRTRAEGGACEACAACPHHCCFGTQPPDAYLASMELEHRRKNAVRDRSKMRRDARARYALGATTE